MFWVLVHDLRKLGNIARPPQFLGDGLVCRLNKRRNNCATAVHDDGDYAAFLDALRDLKRSRRFDEG